MKINTLLRDELLNGEVFYSLKEAQIIIEQWRHHYNTKRPHSSLGHRTSEPEAITPLQQRPTINLRSNRTNQTGLTNRVCQQGEIFIEIPSTNRRERDGQCFGAWRHDCLCAEFRR